jgi:hypothetical protein
MTFWLKARRASGLNQLPTFTASPFLTREFNNEVQHLEKQEGA